MTLQEFSAARRAVESLSASLPEYVNPELYAGPGVIYPGDLAIELCHDSDDYCLVIGNAEYTGTLEELEPILYEFAVSEGIEEVVGHG